MASTSATIVARILTSPTRRAFGRSLAEMGRRMSNAPHSVDYFHRVDDPYCHLMVQVLPEFARRFGLHLRAHVIGRVDPDMLPEKEMLEAYDLRDAADLARLYGLDFPADPTRRGEAVAERAGLRLAEAAASPRFLEEARRIGDAFWTGGEIEPPAHPETARAHLSVSENFLKRKGHYFAATLRYGGEWYWGLDRLGHLEERLTALGLGGGEIRYDRTWAGVMEKSDRAPAPDEPPLEFYFSIRSPYSYVGFRRVRDFAAAMSLRLELKPVLPMMMRGMKVPTAKRVYIITDTKREAERAGLPFGLIADPLGAGVERVYAVAHWARETGGAETMERFFDCAYRGIWSQAIDAGSDAGLKKLVVRAGLDWSDARAALDAEGWRDWVQANRDEMFGLGLWGVPSLRFGDTAVWGQDRFWRIREAVEAGRGAAADRDRAG